MVQSLALGFFIHCTKSNEKGLGTMGSADLVRCTIGHRGIGTDAASSQRLPTKDGFERVSSVFETVEWHCMICDSILGSRVCVYMCVKHDGSHVTRGSESASILGSFHTRNSTLHISIPPKLGILFIHESPVTVLVASLSKFPPVSSLFSPPFLLSFSPPLLFS